MSLAGPNRNPPVIRRGQTVTFRNLESDGTPVPLDHLVQGTL